MLSSDDARHYVDVMSRIAYPEQMPVAAPSNHLEQVERELGLLHAAANELAIGLGELRQAIRSIREDDEEPPTESPCSSCPKFDTCSTPCDELMRLLPPENQGQLRRRIQVPLDVLHPDRKAEMRDHRDIFERFHSCRAELTAKQWEVVDAVYGRGLSQKATARRLQKAESTISELLAGATKTMFNFHSRALRPFSGDAE